MAETNDAEPQPARTADAMRAMAHPARLQIYELLVLHGESTASGLAARSGLAVGSVSHHLRQLLRAGLVRETGNLGGDRRRRWWAAVSGGLRWSPSDFAASSSGQQEAAVAEEARTERRIRRLARWQRSVHTWPESWQQAVLSSETVLRLQPDELVAFGAELQEVINRWSRRAEATSSPAGAPDGAVEPRRTVLAFLHAFPLPEEPRGGAEIPEERATSEPRESS